MFSHVLDNRILSPIVDCDPAETPALSDDLPSNATLGDYECTVEVSQYDIVDEVFERAEQQDWLPENCQSSDNCDGESETVPWAPDGSQEDYIRRYAPPVRWAFSCNDHVFDCWCPDWPGADLGFIPMPCCPDPPTTPISPPSLEPENDQIEDTIVDELSPTVVLDYFPQINPESSPTKSQIWNYVTQWF